MQNLVSQLTWTHSQNNPVNLIDLLGLQGYTPLANDGKIVNPKINSSALLIASWQTQQTVQPVLYPKLTVGQNSLNQILISAQEDPKPNLSAILAPPTYAPPTLAPNPNAFMALVKPSDSPLNIFDTAAIESAFANSPVANIIGFWTDAYNNHNQGPVDPLLASLAELGIGGPFDYIASELSYEPNVNTEEKIFDGLTDFLEDYTIDYAKSYCHKSAHH